MSEKPLNAKAYGHIPHLPDSRMGPGDHKIHEGQARIATKRVRDRHDVVIVTEKLDGSCTAVANIDGKIHALGRAGWPAQSSPYEQHQLFAAWVRELEGLFLEHLEPGQRIVGEWLAQAHGTKYRLFHEPWVAFDVMEGKQRWSHQRAWCLFSAMRLQVPALLWHGAPRDVPCIMRMLERNGQYSPRAYGFHGALEPVEGAVWRVERKGVFDFLCKYVRPDKVDGKYLPEISGESAVWNWRPAKREADKLEPEHQTAEKAK